MKTLFLFLCVSFSAFANDYILPEYNTPITDIAQRGISKESLFDGLDRRFINVKNSICSNRALMWVNDMKRSRYIDAAKIFLFYTDMSGEVGRKTWWYHVSPVVNENNQLWVIDGGFPGWIDAPLTVNDWLKQFTSSTKCKEIKEADTDLIEKMFEMRQYPRTTKHGYYECYYRITPAGYWTPASIAMNILGVDEDGSPVHHVRDEIDRGDLMQACREATRRFLSPTQRQCQDYVNRW